MTNPFQRINEQNRARMRLKSLGMKSRLNRDGRPSTRNLDKKFRAPRVIENKETGGYTLDPRDSLKVSPSVSIKRDSHGKEILDFHGKDPNSKRTIDATSTSGDLSSFRGSGVTSGNKSNNYLKYRHKTNIDRQKRTVVPTKSLNKSSPRRRKNGGIHIPSQAEMAAESVRYLIWFRKRLITLEWFAEFTHSTLTSEITILLNRVDTYLAKNCKDLGSVIKDDEVFKAAMRGRFAKDGSRCLPKVDSQMKRKAWICMGGKVKFK